MDCGHIDYKKPTKLLCGQGCSLCRGKAISKSKTKTNEHFKKELEEKGINYIELLNEYTGKNNKIKIKNLKCNHIYEQISGNTLNGSGCPVCHGMKDTTSFKKIINEKYPNKYKILGEYVNNRTKISVMHKCGYKWDVIPKDLLREERCPKCMMSKGELFIKEYLEKHNIKYVPQYIFKDCKDEKPLRFDFAIFVDNKIKLIEFDGLQHFTKTKSMYTTEKIKKHDEIKNKYCKNHNIELLRIPYWWLRSKRISMELNSFINK